MLRSKGTNNGDDDQQTRHHAYVQQCLYQRGMRCHEMRRYTTPVCLARDQVMGERVADELPELHCHSGQVITRTKLQHNSYPCSATFSKPSMHVVVTGTDCIHVAHAVVVGLLQPALCASKSRNVRPALYDRVCDCVSRCIGIRTRRSWCLQLSSYK